jgi:hypothetical protein
MMEALFGVSSQLGLRWAAWQSKRDRPTIRFIRTGNSRMLGAFRLEFAHNYERIRGVGIGRVVTNLVLLLGLIWFSTWMI